MSEPLEPRVKTVEDAVRLLTELTLRADERMDNFDGALSSFDGALSNLTVKVEALADAQIRTEEAVTRLADRLDRYLSNGRG